MDGQLLPTNLCEFVWLFFIKAQDTQEVSQERNKLKDGLNNWPKREERIAQNFGELISYTSQSQ